MNNHKRPMTFCSVSIVALHDNLWDVVKKILTGGSGLYSETYIATHRKCSARFNTFNTVHPGSLATRNPEIFRELRNIYDDDRT